MKIFIYFILAFLLTSCGLDQDTMDTIGEWWYKVWDDIIDLIGLVIQLVFITLWNILWGVATWLWTEIIYPLLYWAYDSFLYWLDIALAVYREFLDAWLYLLNKAALSSPLVTAAWSHINFFIDVPAIITLLTGIWTLQIIITLLWHSFGMIPVVGSFFRK